MRRVLIVGSTGSIGTQALDVVERSGELEVVGLAASASWELLLEQAGRAQEARAEYAAALAALASLPPARQRTPASITLAASAREGIERLARVSAEPAR